MTLYIVTKNFETGITDTFYLNDIKVFSFSTMGVSAYKLYTIDKDGNSHNFEGVVSIDVEND